jgi:class 3 adenylate cyclase/tetratricopeptide (TPR) repeat protein
MNTRCASCGREGGSGRFCEGCGAPLERSCPSCAATVALDASFCASCGLRLEDARSAASEGERRQLAVLFCDVVDSTPLAQRMDVEDFGELMLAVQQLATNVITDFGGTVGDYAGDGLVAWFGWPVAHEDDTALAVHAGLEILVQLGKLGNDVARASGAPLAARLAVHVGPVVVRTDRPDTPVFGETIHVAARLEKFAEPDTLVISDLARRVVSGRFHTSQLAPAHLKGLSGPVTAYRVDGPIVADEREPAAAFPAPLIGRERELEHLLGTWQQARRGLGRTALISGEPGVGKSRLLLTLKESLAREPHRWLQLRCSPLAVNSAFRPVADMIRSGLGIRDSEDTAERMRKIEAAVPGGGGRVIASLLGIDADEPLAPEKFRHDLMEALHGWMLSLASEAPVVLAGEDMHWSDASTLELIALLQDRLAHQPVLIVLTRRAEPAIDLPSSIELVLDRLNEEQTRVLTTHLAAGAGLSPDVLARVVERSDGVPLFIEELVAAAGESDAGGLPTSLHSLLLARLDRLGPARELAQIASVLGRSFPEPLLAAASDASPAELAEGLGRLRAARLIESSASGDGVRHQFRHALLRDAAYGSLLKSRRTQLHRNVAYALERQFPDLVASSPELLGHHLAHGEGEELLRAAHCFERAGRRAAASAALAEAAAHYRHGIELLADLAPSEGRDRREMWLGILLANAMMGFEGVGAESLRPVWQRAIELGERVGDADELTAALNGLAVEEADIGNLDAAMELAVRQIEIAEETGSRFARLRGEGTLGMVLFYRGRGREALEHLRASLACYEPGDFQTVTFGVGHDQGIFARMMSSWTLWWLGMPDAALAEIEQTVEEAERLGSFLSLAMARHGLMLVYQLRRESEAALQQAQLNVKFAHELHFVFWEGLGLLAAGAERVRVGDRDGLGDVAGAIRLLADASSRSGGSSGLATLAEALHAAGDSQAALATVDAALELSSELDQPFWNPELMRLKAEFLCALDPTAGESAEALLRTALSDAMEYGAAAFALRVATALARALSQRGSSARAGDMLAAALDAIEGGEDTADVRDARALFEELTAGSLEAKEPR